MDFTLYAFSSEFRDDIKAMKHKLNLLEEDTTQMAIDQATFDSALTPYLAAVSNYVTAAQAYFTAAQAALANVPGVDLTNEQSQVTSAQTALATAVEAIPPDPSIPVPVVTAPTT